MGSHCTHSLTRQGQQVISTSSLSLIRLSFVHFHALHTYILFREQFRNSYQLPSRVHTSNITHMHARILQTLRWPVLRLLNQQERKINIKVILMGNLLTGCLAEM